MDLKRNKMFAVKLLHFAASVASFFLAWLVFRYGWPPTATEQGFRYDVLVALGYAVLLIMLYRTYNTYLVGYSRIRTLAFGQVLAQFFSAAAVWIVVCAGWAKLRSPLPFFALLAVQVLLDAAWSWAASRYFFRLNGRKRTLLIYRSPHDKRHFRSMSGEPTQKLYRVEDEFQYDGDFEGLEPRLEGYDAIFVAGLNSRCRNHVLTYCKENGVAGFFLPHIGDVLMKDAIHIQSFDSPVLYVNRTALKPEYAAVKRVFDIIASGLGIVVLSPLFLLTALAIKAYDHGPAIYRQVRLTKDGREFEILKFRSMRVDAEGDGVARLSSGDDDDRITPIGRVVRKCRLDELPQLVNILKGDMSIVGPRPERPEIAAQYCATMPEFDLRLQVKAGLTGYAQVYGKYNTDPYEKLEFDLLYIENMSVLTDLKLMFATVGVLFSPESTEGIAQGQTTAMADEGSEG